MRVCLVYDCLYPWTVGGAERWYRNLAAALVEAGHDVTYLTRRQWPVGEEPDIPGVRVVAVSGEAPLYGPDGNRKVAPPVRFGVGVARHLLRHRRHYDVVHACAFPYFSLLAIRLALMGARRTSVAIDWFEVWTPEYWRAYLGTIGGRVGHAVQRLCVRLTPYAFVYSDVHARRLRDEGLRAPVEQLAGLYAGPLEPRASLTDSRAPLVVYAGRHIREKRVPLVPAAVAAARERVPELRAVVLGDGPERGAVLAEVERLGLRGIVDVPGFVPPGDVDDAIARASCLVLPSAREGYGLVVIEAAAVGTPSVVVAGPDNASVELIEEGVNGFVAPEPEPAAIATAIERVHEAGPALRERTHAWFRREGTRRTARASAELVASRYAAWASVRR